MSAECEKVHPGYRHVEYAEAVDKAARFAQQLVKRDELVRELERQIAQLRHDLYWARVV